MKLIVGLGNPGKKYEKTRHNVGWLVLDNLKQAISKSKFLISNQIPNPKFQFEKKFNAETLRIGNVILAKPQTFMNSSGIAVSSLYSYFKIHNTNLYVIHDDLDIKLGEYKIQFGKGPKVHNGVQSIEEKLGTKEFWRVRVGIENRRLMINDKSQMTNGGKILGGPVYDGSNLTMEGKDYVLQRFTEEEREILNKTVDKLLIDIMEIVACSK